MASEKLAEIREHLEGIQVELEALPPLPSDAMTYPELKMQLMVNYVTNLSFYLALKQRGESVADHPVFKHLALLRTFLERLAPLDASLKYQIEKLLLAKDAEDDETTTEEPVSAGPDLSAFMSSSKMKDAVKGVSVEQVKKASGALEGMASGSQRLEIDPSLIAARIAKLQQSATKKPVAKKKAAVGSDDDFGSSDFEEAPKKKSKKKDAKKSKKVSDDEEIESDFEL